MNNIKVALIFVIFIMVGCSPEPIERIEITIFTEGLPASDLQFEVNEMLKNNRVSTVSWISDPPANIQQLPTFIVRSHKGTFQTSDKREFEDYIHSLTIIH